jgi:hypothetical protein
MAPGDKLLRCSKLPKIPNTQNNILMVNATGNTTNRPLKNKFNALVVPLFSGEFSGNGIGLFSIIK